MIALAESSENYLDNTGDVALNSETERKANSEDYVESESDSD